MKPEPPAEKNPGEDLKAFDRLPKAAKEMAVLKDDAEKATGPESAALHRTIRRKARAAGDLPPAAPKP